MTKHIFKDEANTAAIQDLLLLRALLKAVQLFNRASGEKQIWKI